MTQVFTLSGKVYIAGGFNGQQVLNSAECYDPDTDVWTNITDMSSQRSGVRLVAYFNQIYVIGGFNGSARLATGNHEGQRILIIDPRFLVICERITVTACKVILL